MTTSDKPIIGTCLLMCPVKEQQMREAEGLLHIFEIDEKTKHMKRPKVDSAKAVKCFSRSAAGRVMSSLHLLRPPDILLSTVRYLFTEIITKKDSNWVLIYDFVFDRLRSIRQDAVIQRIDAAAYIRLLEPIIRFHIYAGQRLCERTISEFDATINNKHLLECIKHLLVLYDEQDSKNATNDLDIHIDLDRITLNNNRSEMEALYILLHIGHQDALKRALTLSTNLKNSSAVKLAIQISLAWYLRNYVRVYHLVQQLSPILACAFFFNLRSFRRNVLQIMAFGYNNNVLTFPGLKLQELLFYKDINRIKTDCKLFGLTFTDENVLFQKTQFDEKILLANPEMYYTTAILQKLAPKIVLECTST